MLGLHGVLAQTQERGVALGHFNVSDLVLLKAVSEAAANSRFRYWLVRRKESGSSSGSISLLLW
jgi:fructose/tagatose bisphosphate aldolase